MRMAGVASARAGHRFQSPLLAMVTRIVDESPGPIKRGRAQIASVPAHHIAGGVADTTANTFNRFVRRLSFFCRRRDDRKRRFGYGARLEIAVRRVPLLKE